ncbi:MAG: 6-phosphofructokinase [Gallionella sp.]|jgi:6-phosphofructokinase 1
MKHIGLLTSGGDAPGMNAAIRAVVRAATFHGIEVTGIERGYKGMIDGKIRPLGPRDVSGIISRGGTILHTARCHRFMEIEGRKRAVENLVKWGIEGIVVIGGDGSYQGAAKLHEEFGIRCIGLPGTIDNDIGGTDYTIGFDTAINTAMEAIDRIRDTAASHDRIFFIEVMGRRSGYVAMISGIAGGAEDILLPEVETSVETLIEHLRSGQQRGKQSSIVIVAEGCEYGGALALAKMVEERSEYKDNRITVIGHLQRGGSPSAFDRVLASQMGVRAVEALIAGESGKMVGISGQKLQLRPFSDAWEQRTRFDIDLLRVAHVLSI